MKYGGLKRFSCKWWLALPFSIGDIWKRLTPRDGMVHGMSYWWYGDLERRNVLEVFPGAAAKELDIKNPGRRDPTTSTTLFELSCILMGLHHAGAKRIVEVGTFDGNTTLNLAANAGEDGRVVTLDLPLEDQNPELALAVEGVERNVTDRRIVGEQFQGRPEATRITQVFGDSAKLDWSKLDGPFDMAFIDGCHAYEYVKKDTENALSVLKPGALVMWHDYAEMESVSRAVDEFRDRVDGICALQGTRIAMGYKKKR
ncbi:MAG: class I SAM-dependent methyltransferase [Planctomycetes bacterium]|nr:class I SAM-dependent methyltransferase [Planctomycetota bacterium]